MTHFPLLLGRLLFFPRIKWFLFCLRARRIDTNDHLFKKRRRIEIFVNIRRKNLYQAVSVFSFFKYRRILFVFFFFVARFIVATVLGGFFPKSSLRNVVDKRVKRFIGYSTKEIRFRGQDRTSSDDSVPQFGCLLLADLSKSSFSPIYSQIVRIIFLSI